jgi:hypothetical protein
MEPKLLSGAIGHHLLTTLSTPGRRHNQNRLSESLLVYPRGTPSRCGFKPTAFQCQKGVGNGGKVPALGGRASVPILFAFTGTVAALPPQSIPSFNRNFGEQPRIPQSGQLAWSALSGPPPMESLVLAACVLRPQPEAP